MNAPSVQSAVYRGTIMHHRLSPRRHRFVYRIRSFLFDVDSLEATAQRCRFLSINRFNLFSFHHRDHGAGDGRSPRCYLEQSLRDQGITTALGSAAMLCYPRILGFTFNPLTVYFCYDHQQRLFAILYEVNNTFGERHGYLMPVEDERRGHIRQACDKAFYVSPFMPMAQRYHFRVLPPADNVQIAIRQTEEGSPVMNTVFRGERHALNDAELLRCFFGMPLMTLKVVLAIHWEALRLWLKGLSLQPRPRPPTQHVSFASSTSATKTDR